MGVEFAAHKPPFRRGPSFAPRRRRPDSSPGGASRLRDSAGFQPVFAALRRTRAPYPGTRVVSPTPGRPQCRPDGPLPQMRERDPDVGREVPIGASLRVLIPESLGGFEATEDGRAWLARLPRLVDECAEQWSLQLGDPFANAHALLALPADSSDGERAVLKIQFPDRESANEATALEHWGGKGAVRLLDHDPVRRALLLERADPGVHLSALGPEDALDVVMGLLPRLWVPAAEPFRPLAAEAAELAEEMTSDWKRSGGSVDRRLLDAALEAFEQLSNTQDEQVLVNQDLHADNVLSARREPWLVIDPKPLSGEREFGVVAIVRGGELGHSRGAVIGRLDRVSAELGLGRERVRLWTLAHTLAWGFDENGPMPEHVETATWLLDAG
jgi:streptomycin 6-kinase